MRSMSLLTKAGLVLCLVGVFALVSAPRAEAAFFAYICNDAACSGGDDIFVQDNNVTSGNSGVDTFGAVTGFIQLNATLGGFDILVNHSQSKPALALGMDLNYTVTPLTGGGGSIWLYATDTGFTNPGSLSGVLGGTSDNGAVTAFLCGGNSNTALDLSSCSSGTDVSPTAIAINLAHLATANPYALTLGVRIDLTGPGTTATGDFRVVPEPTSMALLGIGLLGVGVAARRRARRKS